MTGDIMTGRAIDQILPNPGSPVLFEDYIKDARGYLELAERTTGLISRPVAPDALWSDVVPAIGKLDPDLRIINLETAITRSDDYWRLKQVHYRMNPANLACITALKPDVCSLANNHILDWGYEGLKETIATLSAAKIKCTGAGMTLAAAEAPAVKEIEGKGRVIVFGYGSPSSGVSTDWAARENRPGVDFLPDYSEPTISAIRERIRSEKRKGDIVVLSLHWGANWGYEISREEIRFAHRLADAGVDIVHGHSSHHVKGIEIYKDKLILYGCGDLVNDYEGIPGFDIYRGDLGLMYFADMDPNSGRLMELNMMPIRIRNLRVNRASQDEAMEMGSMLNRECGIFGLQVRMGSDGVFRLTGSGAKQRRAA